MVSRSLFISMNSRSKTRLKIESAETETAQNQTLLAFSINFGTDFTQHPKQSPPLPLPSVKCQRQGAITPPRSTGQSASWTISTSSTGWTMAGATIPRRWARSGPPPPIGHLSPAWRREWGAARRSRPRGAEEEAARGRATAAQSPPPELPPPRGTAGSAGPSASPNLTVRCSSVAGSAITSPAMPLPSALSRR